MKFKVLGCSGSRVPGYYTTSYLVDDHILVDGGSVVGCLDLDDQAEITDVLISHANLDHTKDIPFLADNLLATNMNKPEPVRLRSLPRVLDSLREHIFNDDVWPDFTSLPSPERPVLALEPLEIGQAVRLGRYNVQPFFVDHSICSCGFAIYADDPAEHVVITGDTGLDGGWTDFLNDLPFKVENLVVEASFPNELEELARASKHMTPKLLARKLAKLKDMPTPFITHIKAPYTVTIQRQLRDALADYPYYLLNKGDRLVF